MYRGCATTLYSTAGGSTSTFSPGEVSAAPVWQHDQTEARQKGRYLCERLVIFWRYCAPKQRDHAAVALGGLEGENG